MRTKIPRVCLALEPFMKDYVICFESHSLLIQQILTEHALDIYGCLPMWICDQPLIYQTFPDFLLCARCGDRFWYRLKKKKISKPGPCPPGILWLENHSSITPEKEIKNVCSALFLMQDHNHMYKVIEYVLIFLFSPTPAAFFRLLCAVPAPVACWIWIPLPDGTVGFGQWDSPVGKCSREGIRHSRSHFFSVPSWVTTVCGRDCVCWGLWLPLGGLLQFSLGSSKVPTLQ